MERTERVYVEFDFTTWTFRPQGRKGRQWMRDNLYNPKGQVFLRAHGPMIWRALKEEGFDLVPVVLPDDEHLHRLPSLPPTHHSVWPWVDRFTEDIEKALLRIALSIVMLAHLGDFVRRTFS